MIRREKEVKTQILSLKPLALPFPSFSSEHLGFVHIQIRK
jgi:hypothetical protein